jgi:hypothetical protein
MSKMQGKNRDFMAARGHWAGAMGLFHDIENPQVFRQNRGKIKKCRGCGLDNAVGFGVR